MTPLYRLCYRLDVYQADTKPDSVGPISLHMAVVRAREWIGHEQSPLVKAVLLARLKADPFQRLHVNGKNGGWVQWIEEA